MEHDALGFAEADLTERAAEAMKAASRAYVDALVAGLSDQGFDALTPVSLSILSRLPEAGVQAAALARATGRSKQATGKLIAELERAGYVERAVDPADLRAMLVRPSDRGRAALSAGSEIKARLSHQVAGRVGVERLSRLERDLAEIAEILTHASA